MTGNPRLGLLGLGLKAGTVVVGTAGVRGELQAGRLALVVLAEDHGPRTEEKVGRLARARGIPVILGPAAPQLGRQLGRDAVRAVGVRDRKLAAGLLAGTNREEAGGMSRRKA